MGRTNISYTVERRAPKIFWWYQTCDRTWSIVWAYLDFNAPFEIHTDASKLQIGAVISQKGKLIVLYSGNITSSQQNYTTTEKELLSVVETLK